MPKFTKKPVTVDAVRYEPGMEDGTVLFSCGDKVPILIDERDSYNPDYSLIYKDSWIVTHEDGSREVVYPCAFLEEFDPADAEAQAMMEGE